MVYGQGIVIKIAITGGSGFLGRHLIDHFESLGHTVTAWQRPHGRPIASTSVRVIPGSLDDPESATKLCHGQDAIIHAGVYTPGKRFVGGEGDPATYFQTNVVGSMRLIDTARAQGVKRFVFLSSGAVHQRVLPDGDLDETHPLWPMSLYGAAKASVESIIHAIGWSDEQGSDRQKSEPHGTADQNSEHQNSGHRFVPCTIRPTTIYGVDDPIESSRFYALIASVFRGESVDASGGGKMVHAAEVAAAAECLIQADASHICGQTFNCTAGLISHHEVAQIAKRICRSDSIISGSPKTAGRVMHTQKLRSLGFTFNRQHHLESTIKAIVDHMRSST